MLKLQGDSGSSPVSGDFFDGDFEENLKNKDEFDDYKFEKILGTTTLGDEDIAHECITFPYCVHRVMRTFLGLYPYLEKENRKEVKAIKVLQDPVEYNPKHVEEMRKFISMKKKERCASYSRKEIAPRTIQTLDGHKEIRCEVGRQLRR